MPSKQQHVQKLISYNFFLGYHNIVEFCKQECLPGRRLMQRHGSPPGPIFLIPLGYLNHLSTREEKTDLLYEPNVDKQGSGKEKTEVVESARSLSRSAMSVTGRMCVSIELEPF